MTYKPSCEGRPHYWTPDLGGHRVCRDCGQIQPLDAPLHSVAIQRIIEEVRNDKDAPLSGYNRVYHRHNR